MVEETRSIGLDLASMADAALVALYEMQQEVAAGAREALGRTEQELHRRLDDRKALVIEDEMGRSVERKPKVSYDQGLLTPLKEILSGERLRESYIPEHEVTSVVAAHWDMVKVNKHARAMGGRAAEIVDAARTEGRGNLKLVVKP